MDAPPRLFTVALHHVHEPAATWLAVLDAGERERVSRFRRASDRVAFAAAHALTRLVLAAERSETTSPAALRFSTTAFGKPTLPGGPHFNLSHTGGLAALAVWHSGPVGVDVEHVGTSGASAEVARSVLTAAEQAWLKEQPDGARAFLALWTAKEAVAKAEGQGLSLPLAAIAVRSSAAHGPSGCWRLWRNEPDPGILLALAWAAGQDAAPPRHHALTADALTGWAATKGADVHV